MTPTPLKAPACAACCGGVRPGAPAAAPSTPGPLRNPSVSPRARYGAGPPAPSNPHPVGWLRFGQAARRVTSTQRGRRSATADFRTSPRGSQALRGGSKIWVSGEQGVGGYEQGYARDRRVKNDPDISPSEIEAMLRAYEDGGNWTT